MFEVLMKRNGIDKDFRSCRAVSWDQPFADHCTFASEKAAKMYVAKMVRRHKSAVQWKVVPFAK